MSNIRFQSGLPFVRCSLRCLHPDSEIETGWLLLDTGSEISFRCNPLHYSQAEIGKTGEVEWICTHSSEKIPVLDKNLYELYLHGLPWLKHVWRIVNFPLLSTIAPHPLIGILGMDLLTRMEILIDFNNNNIIPLQLSRITVPGVPLDWNPGNFSTMVEIRSSHISTNRIPMIVDTGTNRTVLPAGLFTKQMLSPSSVHEPQNSSNTSCIHGIQLQLGLKMFPESSYPVLDDSAFCKMIGIVGMDILRSAKISINSSIRETILFF